MELSTPLVEYLGHVWSSNHLERMPPVTYRSAPNGCAHVIAVTLTRHALHDVVILLKQAAVHFTLVLMFLICVGDAWGILGDSRLQLLRPAITNCTEGDIEVL